MRQFLLIVSLTFVMFLSVFAKDIEEKNTKEILQSVTFYTESFPPFTYENENGVMEGYAVAIVEKIFENLDLNKPDIRLKVWDMAYMLTLISKNPSALFLVSETTARKEQFDFSTQILETKNAVYCNKASKIKISSASDLKKYKYAVEKQDVNISLLQDQGVPEKNIILLGSVETAVEHIAAGRISCMAFSQPVIEKITKVKGLINDNIAFVYMLPPSSQAVGFNHQVNGSVVTLFNDTLTEVLKDKKFIAKIKEQYGVQ